ncbi:Asp-tRNA(Asn)/Glu-tRNA(Gln) amidotransferase subunit GatA [Candidatus Micrarchaeota archaeon]|nr:Asp-tRNA(Asn)/Glu-tRNA(Gln) amidotransferase subunit GatA [Candidatus Micrarchaeota archaeon]
MNATLTLSGALEKARQAETRLNCMAYIAENTSATTGQKKNNTAKTGPLSGVFLGVKDNLCVAGMPASAGSQILQGYVPPFNATAIERLQQQGATIVGKTVMDEFGFGTFNVNTQKIPKNPHDPTRATGGSSGGCGAFTAATGMPSIAESTGGSISAPAAFCGVVGVTPTYGKVSRYGLIDYANSLDKIGTVATTVKEAFDLLDVMAGPDSKDSTCLKPFPEKKATHKAAIVTELFEKADAGVRQKTMNAVDNLKQAGVQVDTVSFHHIESALFAYYIIAMAEASTNLAKYVGLRYGEQPAAEENETYTEFFTRVRGSFGPEAKRRILLGSFARTAGYRGKYYDKACRVRTLVIDEWKGALEKYDVLLTPSMPCIAPKFSEIEKLKPLQHYAMDACTVSPNLAGLPHASIPVNTSENMPVGLQVIGGHFQEKLVRRYSEMVEAAVSKT